MNSFWAKCFDILKQKARTLVLVTIFLVIVKLLHHSWSSYKDRIDEALAIVVIGATLIAIDSLLDMKEAIVGIHDTGEKLENALGKIGQIADALPTVSIGEFPGHLEQIEKLVKKTQNSLDIMLDCADYGSFYDPERHQKFEDALAQIRRDVVVRILVYGRLNYFTARSRFYGKPFSDFCSDTEFTDDFKRYAKSWNDTNRIQTWLKNISTDHFEQGKLRAWLTTYGPLEYVAYVNSLPQDGVRFLDHLSNGWALCKKQSLAVEDEMSFKTLLFCREYQAEERLRRLMDDRGNGSRFLRSINATSPAFIWIRDKDGLAEGVFIIPDSGQSDSRGRAFQTRDKDLLNVFSEPFESKWQNAQAGDGPSYTA